MPMLPVDYFGHDSAYKQLQARGAVGWSTAEEYEAMWQLIAPILPADARVGQQSVLELGCGAGNFSLRLAKEGYRVTGVDISPTAIDWAIRLASQKRLEAGFRVDNVVSLETCGDSTFDIVIDGHCLHCIVGNDRASCLRSVWRVLRPGGQFVVLTMCGEVRNERLRPLLDSASRLVVVNERPTRYIGMADDIVAEVKSADFLVEDLRVSLRTTDSDQDDLIMFCRRSE